MIGPLTARLARLCDETAPTLTDPAARATVEALGARLAEPRIRIAIGGRIKAGKSTMVNALLGQRLAATGVGETTMLVSWFQHGPQDRVRVHRQDGSVSIVPAARGGGVPEHIEDPATVSYLEVETPNEALARRHTVVDTPGLNSLSALDAYSLAAMADADAVVYLMPHPGENDLAALESIRSSAGELRLGAANLIGVLSRIDTLSGAENPWPDARRVAERYAGELSSALSTVVPVVGLMAETGLGADFAEGDHAAVRALTAVDPVDLEDALLSVQDFLAWPDCPVSEERRHRLLRLLGLYGTSVAVEVVRGGSRTTADLLAELTRRSGIDTVLHHIERVFVAGADRLRATAAVAALEELVWRDDGSCLADRPVLVRLRAELDRVRLEPAMRQVELAKGLADVARGLLRLETTDLQALTALATGADDAARLGLPRSAGPDRIRDAADVRIRRWRTLEGRPSRPLQRYARAARELTEHAYFAAAHPPSGRR
ncbi:dynamin family protein [Actinomycetospora termitidis]|uniref:Dynamin family protein n=1 Tax=Actinomycetospora termitidis TaxID=3053470 RepID=A0ABT7ME59_9PSEU|nr:dynamin family protein [Actinomycetospora sp. Odt1-22]MDL5158948.1 dynamin family protein [Actinomycetospora sp. Odt1-22]